MYYVIWFIGGCIFNIVYDKVKAKMTFFFVNNSIKMIKYHQQWHESNPLHWTIQWAEWVLL